MKNTTLLALLLAAFVFTANAQTTAFTYQGRLTDTTMPANAAYDFQFQLYSPLGTVGSAINADDIQVNNGVFTVVLDFGESFTQSTTIGGSRTLEIRIRPGASTGAYTILTPRQPVTAAPLAIASINSQKLAGIAASSYLQTNGSGANLTSLNASSITTGIVPDAQLASNVARTNAANVFTADQTINNADLYQSGGLAIFNAQSGFVASGSLTNGVIPASGAGTRMMFYPGKAAFRGGYVTSTQWDDTFIGLYSTATGYNTVAGGDSSIAMGNQTIAIGDNSTAIGLRTVASGSRSTATGSFTTASGDFSTAIGANVSTNSQMGSFVYGDNSTVTIFNAVAPNSFTMRATGGFAAVGTFGAGVIPATGAGTRMMFYPNKAAFRAGYVSGTQWDNVNIGEYSIASGYNTTANGNRSIALGTGTTASGFSSVALNNGTTASGDYSIATGQGTIASGNYSTAMGQGTIASGIYSTAMGYGASTNNQAGSFVYADSSNLLPIASNAPNQFVVRAQKMWFGTNNSVTNTANRFIETSTGAYLSTSGVWTDNSSRNLKTNFTAVDSRAVLQKVLKLPISTWNYKVDSPDIRHIGAMAQDFRAAFNVGADDEHITAVDTAGVSMAAIQGLNAELEERTTKLQAENDAQQKTIERQQREIDELKEQQKQIDELKAIVCPLKPDAAVCKAKQKEL